MEKNIYLLLLALISMLYSCKSPGVSSWKLNIIDNTGVGADGAKLTDINGDSYPDLVVGWEQSGVVRVYLHPVSRDKEWQFVELPAPNVEDALAVDLDNDGNMDVVSFSEGKHQRITFHFSPSNSASFLDSSAWESMDLPLSVYLTRWMFGRAADIDNKNGIDLIVGGKGESCVGWLESPPNPRELDKWKFHELRDASWIMSLEWVDIDKDGLNDILFSDRKKESDGIFWLKNPGEDKVDSSGLWTENYIGLRSRRPMFIDHYMDKDEKWVILSGSESRLIYECKQSDNPLLFEECNTISLPDDSPEWTKSIDAANIDGDINIEWVVSTGRGANDNVGIWVLDKESSSEFLPLSDLQGEKFDFVSLVDMDLDGDLDVLTCEEANNGQNGNGLGVIWYENPYK